MYSVDTTRLPGDRYLADITATRRTDKKEFNGKRYIKIENDRHSDE